MKGNVIPFHTPNFDLLETLTLSLDNMKDVNDLLGALPECCEIYGLAEFEIRDLVKLARSKRLELARPAQTKETVTGPGSYAYTPEMGQEKPDCQIEADLAHGGRHYFLFTNLELKGRGITREKDHPDGRHTYYVTSRAYRLLEEKYSISRCSYLD
jgi:hypothetical protein